MAESAEALLLADTRVILHIDLDAYYTQVGALAASPLPPLVASAPPPPPPRSPPPAPVPPPRRSSAGGAAAAGNP
jgi:hypothetical protein